MSLEEFILNYGYDNRNQKLDKSCNLIESCNKIIIKNSSLKELPPNIDKLIYVKTFIIISSKIEIIDLLPPNIEYIEFSYNPLKFLMNIPPNIKSIVANYNNLVDMEIEYDKHENLQYIDYSFNNLKYIPKLPPNVEYINVLKNRIEEIDCSYMSLQYLTKLKTLILSYNKLEYLPKLNDKIDIETLMIDNNPIKFLRNRSIYFKNIKYFTIDSNLYSDLDKLYMMSLPLLKNMINTCYNEKIKYDLLKEVREVVKDKSYFESIKL